MNYEIRRQKVLPAGNKQVFIGELTIGQETIQNLLDALVNDLNRSVFEIFEQLATLQESLQAYFAGGLKKSEQADKAIDASLGIGEKTKEVKSQHSSWHR